MCRSFRCGECSHIYVAHPPGARRGSKARKEDPTKYFIGGGAVLAFGLVMLMVTRGNNDPPPVVDAAPPAVDEDTAPSTGWDSAHVLFARQMHDLALSRNTSKLFVLLDFAKVRDHEVASEATTATEEGQPVILAGWTGLDGAAQTSYRNKIVDDLTSTDGEMAVSAWKPYDGEIVAETENSAIVHLHVQSRSGDLELSDADGVKPFNLGITLYPGIPSKLVTLPITHGTYQYRTHNLCPITPTFFLIIIFL